MMGETGPINEKLFTYVRYNGELSQTGLNGLGLDNIDYRQVQKIDSIGHINNLQRIGEKIAENFVREGHFF